MLRGTMMGEVAAAVRDVNGLRILVEVWQPCGDILPHSKRYKPECRHECWRVEEVQQSVAWYVGDREVTAVTY